MLLKFIEDHRDALGKLRKRELIELARAQGVTDITETMAADDYTDESGKVTPGIRTILRQRGLNRVPVPNRPLGRAGRHETHPIAPKPAAATPPANAPAPDEWAEFQAWKASRAQAAPQPAANPRRLVERPRSEINMLRDECKRLGIKMDRRDRMGDLKAKIAAHKAGPPTLN